VDGKVARSVDVENLYPDRRDSMRRFLMHGSIRIRLPANAFANGGASRFAQRVQKLGGKPAQHVVWQEQQYLLLRTFGMKYKVLFVNTAP
jgi:hypothetical protein